LIDNIICVNNQQFLYTCTDTNCCNLVNTPYLNLAGPFDDIKIEGNDEDILTSGKAIMKQSGDGDGGSVICVQDVNAPKTAVWKQILDLDNYVGKVPKLKHCKNYLVKNLEDGTMQIKTKMIVGVMPGYKYEYYCDHKVVADSDSVTWSLDYEKTSDFDDVAGHWHVEDHPTNIGCSRLFYACDIKFKSPVPSPIINFVTKKALKQATSWVKKESEEQQDPENASESEEKIAFGLER